MLKVLILRCLPVRTRPLLRLGSCKPRLFFAVPGIRGGRLHSLVQCISVDARSNAVVGLDNDIRRMAVSSFAETESRSSPVRLLDGSGGQRALQLLAALGPFDGADRVPHVCLSSRRCNRHLHLPHVRERMAMLVNLYFCLSESVCLSICLFA